MVSLDLYNIHICDVTLQLNDTAGSATRLKLRVCTLLQHYTSRLHRGRGISEDFRFPSLKGVEGYVDLIFHYKELAALKL